MRKIKILLLILLSSFCLFAEDIALNPSFHDITNKYEKDMLIKKEDLIKEFNEKAKIEAKRKIDFFAGGSFLYWRASERGLSYAKTNYLDHSKHHKLHFEYDPAFKLSFGLNFIKEDFKVLFEYMSFNAKINTSKEKGFNQSLQPTWRTHGCEAKQIQTKWSLNLETIDVKIATPFYKGKKLIFKPFLGARGGFIDQKVNSTTTKLKTDSILEDEATSSSWILGPRAGVNTSWNFHKKLSFYSNLSTSLLFQRFNVTYQEASPFFPTLLMYNLEDDIDYLTPNLDISLGITWKTSFIKDKTKNISIVAGYELEFFSNQNMMRYLKDLSTPGETKGPGSLLVQGLTATARFDF